MPLRCRLLASAVLTVFVWLAGASWSFAALPLDVFPGESTFRPFLADPREAQYLLRYVIGNGRARGEAAFGETFGLVRLEGTRPLQLGLQASVYTRFNRDVDSAGFLDINSADYTIALPLDLRYDRLDVRVSVGHLSSHFGESEVQRRILFDGANFFDRTFLYRRDFVRGLVSSDLTETLRVYGGGSYAIHITPQQPRPVGQVGLEARLPARGWGPLRRQWYLAVDLQSWAEADWTMNTNVQVGVRLGRGHSSRRVRVALEAYQGKSLQRIIGRQRERYASLGLFFEF
jgi:hypothetical protein